MNLWALIKLGRSLYKLKVKRSHNHHHHHHHRHRHQYGLTNVVCNIKCVLLDIYFTKYYLLDAREFVR